MNRATLRSIPICELIYVDWRKKAQLMPIIDHAIKLVMGWVVGKRAITELALADWR